MSRKLQYIGSGISQRLASVTLALLVCAGAQAATISTTLTVSATVSVGTSFVATGTATFTNGVGSGTFTSTLTAGAAGFTGPYTITLSGGGGTITGTMTAPTAILTGSGTVVATVTGGTGTYAGATGSFPSMPGTGSVGATGSITLSFSGAGTITTGGTVGPPPPASPTITAVLDGTNSSGNVAPGGFYTIKGTTLCKSSTDLVYSIPRPTVGTDGVKVTFTPTAGGAGTDAILYYEVACSSTSQLAGIVPSSVAPGSYNVTVTNGTVSAPFPTQVMAHKFSLFTQDSSGSGLASVQNYISASQVDLNSFTTGTGKFTTISPAHPGQFLLAYGTGMGALAGQDNAASPAYDFSTNGVTVTAIIGGMTVPVAYAGRAGYAAEDQINVSLPSNVPTGCTVSFQISVNGVLSSLTFIAIAPDASSSACVQAGFTTAQLAAFDQGGSYSAGGFSLSQISEAIPSLGSVKINSASGSFTKYTGYQLSGAAQAVVSSTTSGACTVTHVTTTGNNTATVSGGIGLDAGAVTLNGPAASSISNMAFTEGAAPGYGYSLTLAEQGLPIGGGTGTLVAGTYTVTGAGGKDVGKFSGTITIGSPLTLTSNGGVLPTTVVRSAGLPLSWTGGNSTDVVEVIGSASTSTGSGANAVTDTWGFVCTTTAGTGGFTVPSSVLNQMPAVTLSSTGSGGGFLEVASSPNPVKFTAPLVSGSNLDAALFSAFVGIGGQVGYQ